MKLCNYLWALMFICFVATGCSDDDVHGPKQPQSVKVTLNTRVPEKWSVADLGEIIVTVTNKTTAHAETLKLQVEDNHTIDLPKGIYDLSAEGAIGDLTFTGQVTDLSVQSNMDVDLLLVPAQTGAFVIREIFYSGATTKEGNKPYNFASYVVLTNNSDKTLYADGISFIGTQTNTALPADPGIADLLPGRVVGQFVFTIPGSGKEHAVEPGKDIVIAMEAKNHSEVANNVPDLTKADFEWFEPNDRYQLTDNPNVPNMIIDFKTSLSITALHVRGYTSYFIARLPKPFGQVIKEDKYDYQPPNPRFPVVALPAIPVEWIIDGVELFSDDQIKTKALPSSVDKSHTWTSEMKKGWVVTRKVSYTVEGRKVYQDTNDSKEDFLRDQPSSLLYPR